MSGRREAMQKLRVASLTEAEEKCLNIQPLVITSHEANLASGNVTAKLWLGTYIVFFLVLYIHIKQRL